jgi:hypothetical protein
VLNQVFIVVTGIEESVAKDGKPGGVQRPFGHLSLIVDGLSKTGDEAVVPVEDGGREWLRRRPESGHRNSHNVTEEVTLFRVFCLLCLPCAFVIGC